MNPDSASDYRSLLTQTLKGSRQWLKLLGPCHSEGGLEAVAGPSFAQPQPLWTFGKESGRWEVSSVLSLPLQKKYIFFNLKLFDVEHVVIFL